MHIAVVANGDLPSSDSQSVRQLLGSVDRVIAVDGGLVHCVALGRWPDRLVGDLDSAPRELVDQAQSGGATVLEHPVDKDATDLELALEDAVLLGADTVTVVAAFGGRLDHELATVGLIASPRWAKLTLSAADGRRHMWVVRRELELALEPNVTVSLVPWAGPVTGVTTNGLQWPLTDDTLELGSTRGVSNVVVHAIQRVSISSGTLLVISDEYE